jgi:hypothetical protein
MAWTVSVTLGRLIGRLGLKRNSQELIGDKKNNFLTHPIFLLFVKGPFGFYC